MCAGHTIPGETRIPATPVAYYILRHVASSKYSVGKLNLEGIANKNQLSEIGNNKHIRYKAIIWRAPEPSARTILPSGFTNQIIGIL